MRNPFGRSGSFSLLTWGVVKKIIFAASSALLTSQAHAITLYYNNFDGGVIVDSGVGVTAFSNGGLDAATVGAWNASGWSGNYFINNSSGDPAAASTLTLTNLKPHTAVSLSGVLGFLESWDSNNGSCCSPDFLRVSIDGNPVAIMTANNALGSLQDFAGSTVVA